MSQVRLFGWSLATLLHPSTNGFHRYYILKDPGLYIYMYIYRQTVTYKYIFGQTVIYIYLYILMYMYIICIGLYKCVDRPLYIIYTYICIIYTYLLCIYRDVRINNIAPR
jgi:hypothetical protein